MISAKITSRLNNETTKRRCTPRDHTSCDSFLNNAAARSAAGHSSKPDALIYRSMEPGVNIVTRAEWGAAAPQRRETLAGPAQKVVIHHTAVPGCEDPKECKDRLVSIQRVHMTERDFDDIGYNFLVSSDGTVYEGRGWGVVGAHAKGNNHNSLGIAFMGNFNNETPSPEAISSVQQLLQSGLSQGFLQPGFVLLGHRDLGDTECPGGKLYAALACLRAAL